MVFNENYDRSLWLVLSTDETTKEEVSKIINSIPEDRWEQIRFLIKNEGTGTFVNKLVFFEDKKRYEIRCFNGELSIRVKNADELIDYELTLVAISEDDVDKMRLFSPIHVGSFSEDCIISEKDDLRHGIYLEEYEVVKSPVGEFVCVYMNNEKSVYQYHRVNMKRKPDNMYVHQFQDEKRVDRLVRGRRKNRKYRGN